MLWFFRKLMTSAGVVTIISVLILGYDSFNGLVLNKFLDRYAYTLREYISQLTEGHEIWQGILYNGISQSRYKLIMVILTVSVVLWLIRRLFRLLFVSSVGQRKVTGKRIPSKVAKTVGNAPGPVKSLGIIAIMMGIFLGGSFLANWLGGISASFTNGRTNTIVNKTVMQSTLKVQGKEAIMPRKPIKRVAEKKTKQKSRVVIQEPGCTLENKRQCLALGYPGFRCFKRKDGVYVLHCVR